MIHYNFMMLENIEVTEQKSNNNEFNFLRNDENKPKI